MEAVVVGSTFVDFVEDFVEWTVAILLGVVILTGMSGNSLLDGVEAAAKVPTAAEGNALLLLLLLLLMLLALTDGEGWRGTGRSHRQG